MRLVPLALLVFLPLAGAYPASSPGEIAGVLAEGERDEMSEWLDLWYGEGGWGCTASERQDVLVLTLVEGAADDVLVLETGTQLGARLRASATPSVPAVLYAWSSSGCVDLAVEGAQVHGSASYRVEIYDEWDVLCGAIPC